MLEFDPSSELNSTDGKMIKAGSHSRLAVFETCPFRAALAYIDRIPEPVRPPLPNGQEYPNDRGQRVHDEAEAYVRCTRETLSKELLTFEPELTRLRELFFRGELATRMEQMWCFDRDWQPVSFNNYDAIWLRIKLDVAVFIHDEQALVIDYKTGRRLGMRSNTPSNANSISSVPSSGTLQSRQYALSYGTPTRTSLRAWTSHALKDYGS